MTTFIDGPAQGEILTLHRSPRFLRVTQNGPCFDALDQLGDEPEYTELIYVYELAAPVSAWTIGKSGRVPVASYRHYTHQPADHQIRETHAWRGWTERAAKGT